MLTQRWVNAEQRLLNAGLVDDAINAYLDCQQWVEAIRVARENHHYNLEALESNYLDYLLSTKQLEQAGRMKEKEGDVHVRLWTQGPTSSWYSYVPHM
jgi:hypothetical protein